MRGVASVPIIANGGVRSRADAEAVLAPQAFQDTDSEQVEKKVEGGVICFKKEHAKKAANISLDDVKLGLRQNNVDEAVAEDIKKISYGPLTGKIDVSYKCESTEPILYFLAFALLAFAPSYTHALARQSFMNNWG